MPTLPNASNTVSLFSGIDGDVQIVVGSRGLIILDAQGCERGVDGRLRHNHGIVRLTYELICDLRDFLDRIGEPEDDRQPALPFQPARSSVPIRRPRAA